MKNQHKQTAPQGGIQDTIVLQELSRLKRRIERLEEVCSQNYYYLKECYYVLSAVAKGIPPGFFDDPVEYSDMPLIRTHLLPYILIKARSKTPYQQVPLAITNINEYIKRITEDPLPFEKWITGLIQENSGATMGDWLCFENFASKQTSKEQPGEDIILTSSGGYFIREAYSLYKHISACTYNALL